MRGVKRAPTVMVTEMMNKPNYIMTRDSSGHNYALVPDGFSVRVIDMETSNLRSFNIVNISNICVEGNSIKIFEEKPFSENTRQYVFYLDLSHDDRLGMIGMDAIEQQSYVNEKVKEIAMNLANDTDNAFAAEMCS